MSLQPQVLELQEEAVATVHTNTRSQIVKIAGPFDDRVQVALLVKRWRSLE